MRKRKSTRPNPGSPARWKITRGSRAFVSLLMLVVMCACEARTREADSIPECTSYAASARTCLGPRVADRLSASYSTPPADATARAALREQCSTAHDQLRLSCR